MGGYMRLSELQSKTIISVVDGKNVGSIIDVDVMMDGHIDSLIIESGKSLFNFNRDTDTKILWKDIWKRPLWPGGPDGTDRGGACDKGISDPL